MRLRPGTLVVLEGLDATGKTTQMERLKEHYPDELFIHSPSGSNNLGRSVYEMTETLGSLRPLARQFLHLASHVHMYHDEVIPALSERGVFMDRNWLSTLAYGRAAGVLTEDWWPQVVQLPANGLVPDVVFLFRHPVAVDLHNTAELVRQYGLIARLLAETGSWCRDFRSVPLADEATVTELLLSTLREFSLVT